MYECEMDTIYRKLRAGLPDVWDGKESILFMKNKKVKSKHLGGNWYSGECGDYTFQAKAFVEPSDYGIDCGKVSKLHIQKDDEWRVNYDRGWEIIPRPEDYEAYDAIMEHLNNRPLWPFDFE